MKITPRESHVLRLVSFVSACAVVMGHFGSGVATDAVAGKMYRELFAHGLAVYAVSFFFAVSGFFSMKYFVGALLMKRVAPRIYGLLMGGRG